MLFTKPRIFESSSEREGVAQLNWLAIQGLAYDPYAPIREKINAAREKFREYKEFPCVLHNVDAFLVDLDDWTIVMGSMLADAGFRFAVDRELGRAVGGFTPAFLKRG